MTRADILVDAFERLRDAVYPAVNGLSLEQLAFRPDPESNSIAWLAWHLTRIQDDHIAQLDRVEQAWTAGKWAERFGLPLEPSDTGYGHDPDMVSLVVVGADLLLGYFDATHDKTRRFLGSLSDGDLARVVDPSWNPPVTVSARVVSVLVDDLQHVGQAAYVRGIVQRR